MRRRPRLNKYERAYLRQLRKKQRNAFFRGQRPTIGKIIIYNYYRLKKRFKDNLNSFKKSLSSLRESIKIKMSDIKKIKTKKKLVKKKKKEDLPKVKKTKPVKKKKKMKGGFLKWLKRLFILGVILILLGFGFLFVVFSQLEIPSVDNFDKRKISNSTKIYDKTGEIILYDIHENIQRTVVSGDKIAQSAKDAIIAIEDHTFYEHKGVVWKSTIRAVIQTILSKAGLSSAGQAGGSTLTQQVVKNTLLTRERTYTRKMKEWVLAYKIEQKLTKDEILTVYLNEAPYGGTIYGIQEASRVFFGGVRAEVTLLVG